MGTGKRLMALLSFLFLTLMVTSLPAVAATYTSTKITSNYTNSAPQINLGSQLVWQGFDGQDDEIFTYQGGVVTQLTNNTYKDYNPQINKNGDIVWTGYDGKDDEIYLYHNNVTSKITNNNYNDYLPQINDNGQIAWYGSDGKDYEIYTYINNQIKQLTSNTYQDYNPQVNQNGDITWYGYDGRDYEIYLSSNNVTSKITNNNYNDYDPQINNNKQIAWRSYDGRDYEIYTYANGAVKRLTSNSYQDLSPKINEQGNIVWYGSDGTDNEIYLYKNNAVAKITNNNYQDYDPQINNKGQITWRGSDGKDYEIYSYVDGATTLITSDSYSDYNPQINENGNIVYYKATGSTSDIYLATSSAPVSLSRFNFSFYYGDSSGDNFSGYFYDDPGLYKAGDIIDQTGGYYRISSVSTGNFDTSYDDTAYINSYYDGDTQTISNTLYGVGGHIQTGTSLKVADLLEVNSYVGYVYDPSVPITDAFFGDSEVTYQFGTNQSVNFLAAYITDLPYWNQPSSYPGSCSEIAGAIILSYWDRQGYDNLITTDWQTNWPDDTRSASSYVNFIGTLANYMGYPATPSGGTYTNKIGPGIDNYALNQGYADFAYKYYRNNTSQVRTVNWSTFTNAIDSGHPVMLNVNWSAGGHSTVGRGYWNDGKVVTDYGWGTYYDNVQLDWNRTSGGSEYNTAYISEMIDIYNPTATMSGSSAMASPVAFGINAAAGSYNAEYAGPRSYRMQDSWSRVWNEQETLVQ